MTTKDKLRHVVLILNLLICFILNLFSRLPNAPSNGNAITHMVVSRLMINSDVFVVLRPISVSRLEITL